MILLSFPKNHGNSLIINEIILQSAMTTYILKVNSIREIFVVDIVIKISHVILKHRTLNNPEKKNCLLVVFVSVFPEQI